MNDIFMFCKNTHLCLSGQVHSLSLVLNKKTTELAKASVSKLFTHMEMIG